MRHHYLALLLLVSLAPSAGAGGSVDLCTLSNGITLIHKQSSAAPIVTAHIFVRSGVANEQPRQAGIAHFCQTVMLKGTKTRSDDELSRALEDIGAVMSSDVEYDFTEIGISVSTAGARRGIELLSDIVRNPAFAKDEVEKERGSVLAALKSRQDQIFYTAHDRFNKLFYGNHPYAWPDTGTTASVRALKAADLRQWHVRHYTAGSIFIVIVGDMALETARAACEEFFGSMAQGTKRDPGAVATPRKPTAARVETTKFQQAYLMMGCPAPSVMDDDFPVLKVINTLMGGRMSSRLFTELREKMSLGYEVSSFYPSRAGLSSFVVYLGIAGENLPRAEQKIREMLAALAAERVPDEELADTKNFIRGVYLLDHQTISRQAWHLGWWEALGRGYRYDDEYLNDLMAVTTDDIKRVARRYFTDDYFKVEVVPAAGPR